ncbi:MAG TPA: secretion protein HlyD, partial [Candidatus Melainabacteria bacterium]|nr:secretion protein HlyD [Candidatus Melainabacteria bacterium]
MTTSLNLDRMRELHEKGLRSKRDLELAELEQARALTDLERAYAALDVARRDHTVANLDRDKIAADTDAAMSNISAAMASAQ